MTNEELIRNLIREAGRMYGTEELDAARSAVLARMAEVDALRLQLARVNRARAALNAATLSSSGLDITIACDDHDTKDAIFDWIESEISGGGIAVGVPAQMQGSNDCGLAHDDVKPEDTTRGDRPARPVTCPPETHTDDVGGHG